MTTQPGAASVPPDNETSSSSTDGGMPVGAADAEADARRSGAGDENERPSNVGEGFMLDVDPGQETDGGVPVGRADAEADRTGSAEGDERA